MPTEKKITYLIGAGASANAVPMVNDFGNALFNMINHFEVNGILYDSNEVKALSHEIRNHSSIDTLARKYWLKDDFVKYNKIKTLIALLILFHNVNGNIYDSIILLKKSLRILDHRYDSFLATFLQLQNKKFSLPSQIQFVSWNYDIQFEKALSFYDDENDVIMGLEIFEPHLNRLNGVGIFDNSDYHKFYSLNDIGNTELKEFFVSALSFEKDLITRIQFAWEITDPKPAYKNDISQMRKKIENANKRIKESNYVVVIGYSFPVFNREVDIELFKGFNGKIFIQDIEGKANQIKNQLGAIQTGLDSDSRCEIQTNVDQFFIPNQYWNFPKPKIFKSKISLPYVDLSKQNSDLKGML